MSFANLRSLKILICVGSLGLAAGAAASEARTPLSEDMVIEDGLRLVAIGKLLYRNCDAISPRRIKAFNFARSLYNRARELGYSDAEIDAYLDSDPDKDRVKASARAYLEMRGVQFGSASSFCEVGIAEIREETSIGQFLRAN